MIDRVYEIYSELKINNPDIQVSFHTSIYLTKKMIFFLLRVFQNQKRFIVMRMDIIQFMRAIDTVLIIQIKNGIKKILSSY